MEHVLIHVVPIDAHALLDGQENFAKKVTTLIKTESVMIEIISVDGHIVDDNMAVITQFITFFDISILLTKWLVLAEHVNTFYRFVTVYP